MWILYWWDEMHLETLLFTSSVNLKECNRESLWFCFAIDNGHMMHISKSLVYEELGFLRLMPISPCHLVTFILTNLGVKKSVSKHRSFIQILTQAHGSY